MQIRTLLLVALLAGTAVPAELPAQRRPVTAWTVRVDNDLFALWRSARRRSDRDYSSGVVIEMTRRLAPAACAGGDCQRRWDRLVVASLTQQLYTPDITRPSPGDRPYAALLTGRAALSFDRPEVRHRLGAGVAVTGPPALGAPVQRTVHQLVGSPVPMGWERQIPFEAGLSLWYEGAHRLVALDLSGPLDLNTAGILNVELGTLASAATVGGRATLGYRAPAAWTPDLDGSQAGGGRPRMYLITGAYLDLVARSVVLDGGPDHPRVSLRHRVTVPRAEAGIAIEAGDLTFSWLGYVTGREYDGQPTPHAYGSFRVVVR